MKFRNSPSDKEEISFGYHHDEQRVIDAFNAYLPPSFPVVPINVDRATVRDNLDYQHILSLSSSIRAVWGAELRREAFDSKTLFYGTGGESTTLARLFGNAELRPSQKLTMNAGAMWERYAEHASKFAPRFFANWHLTPGQTLRAGASRAYRAPSLFEERADFRIMVADLLVEQRWLARGKLKPEEITSSEIGYLFQSPSGNATFDLRLYHEELRDSIVEVIIPAPPGALVPETLSHTNSASGTSLRGVEYQLKIRPRPATDILVNQSVLSINSAADPAQNRSAAHSTSGVTWMQRYGRGWSSAATLQHVGAYQWGGGSKPVAAHNSADLRLARNFRWERRQVELALVMRNLGPRYEEFLLATQPGFNSVSRYAYLTGRVEF
jgi:iron complex outermembrane receptor protein